MSSSIKIKTSEAPQQPSTGYSRIYVDEVDGHLKRKRDDGVVLDYDIASVPENIEDIIGAMVTDTSTINLTYDDPSGTLSADVNPNSITDNLISDVSPTKLQDSLFSYKRYTINTNTNVSTLIRAESLLSDGVYLFECKITAFRFSGLGNPGDSATFIRTFRIKVISGLLTIHNTQSDYTSRDVSAYNVNFQILGSDLNVNVVGVTGVNIRWNLELSLTKNI
jgi:hypothetical protein